MIEMKFDASQHTARVPGAGASVPQPSPKSVLPETALLEFALRWAGRAAPQREWHVPGWIPAKKVTMFGGDGGTGKSMLAKQLAVATVLGRFWLGLPVKQGRVVCLSGEDDEDELHGRFKAILAAEGAPADHASLGELFPRSVAGEDALLATFEISSMRPTQLFVALGERVRDYQLDLVVLDTLANLHNGNENDRAVAQQFINLLVSLSARCSCSRIRRGRA